MRVLLVGKGAREHALAWKIGRSPLLTELFVWPGNPGMLAVGKPPTVVDLPSDAGLDRLVERAAALDIHVVVCGSEAPLAEGLADKLAARGIPCFGPRQQAARLESSKAFAKQVMERAKIPTAPFWLAKGEVDCRNRALQLLKEQGGVVLKASGLAAGKGVFVCKTQGEVEEGLRRLYHTNMTEAASTVVVEGLLVGRECSYFTFVGGGESTGLGFAVDFKRLEDGDKGPNTGGMGCYTPVPWLPEGAGEQVERQVVEPLLRILKEDGIDYTGCLYVGLMWSDDGPQVVEFNVRLGDPEAQVLASYDDRDWLGLMVKRLGLETAVDTWRQAAVSDREDSKAVAVVVASQGYPYGEGEGSGALLPKSMFANDDPATLVFGASITEEKDGIATGRGRVLTVVSRGKTFSEARSKAYDKVAEIERCWPSCRYRKDIAARVSAEHS